MSAAHSHGHSVDLAGLGGFPLMHAHPVNSPQLFSTTRKQLAEDSTQACGESQKDGWENDVYLSFNTSVLT